MSESTHVTDQLNDYIAERLDIATVAMVEAHLRDCEECRQQYIAQSQSNESTEAPPAEEAPAVIEMPPASPEAQPVEEPSSSEEIPPTEEAAELTPISESMSEEPAQEQEAPAEPPDESSAAEAVSSPTKRSLRTLALFVGTMIIVGAGLAFIWNARQADLPPPAPPPPAPAPEIVEPAPAPPVVETPQAPVETVPPSPEPPVEPVPVPEAAAPKQVKATPAVKAAPSKTPTKRAPLPAKIEATSSAPADDMPPVETLGKPKAAPKTEDKGGVRLVPHGNPFSSGELPEWKGTASGIKVRRTVAIKTAGQWAALWKEHTVSQTPAPKVDFQNYMIVGIYLGEKPSGGYAVELVNTEEDYPPALIVSYRELSPTGVASTALTQPFHLWVIPQSTLPVKFKKQ